MACQKLPATRHHRSKMPPKLSFFTAGSGASTAPNTKPLRWLALAIIVAGFAAAGWFYTLTQAPAQHPEAGLFRAIEEPRVLLIDVFRSYDSEAAIDAQLGAAALHFHRSVSARPDSARYPPRKVVSLVVDGYRHLGTGGTLTLSFFNDRLMEAEFRPDDSAAYAPALHRQLPQLLRGPTGYAEYRAPPLRIWASVDLARSKVGRSLGAEGLVLWQDERLTAQRDDWDARFGNIPPPAPR